IGFKVGAYDPRYPLVIDPVLNYSAYVGGNGADTVYGIAVDSQGNAYITGDTDSADFPVINPQPQGGSSFKGTQDAYVAKLNPAGTGLIYSTYLGGSGSDSGSAIAVDSSGSAYVTGDTSSADFPAVGAFQPTLGGGAGFDAFVTK